MWNTRIFMLEAPVLILIMTMKHHTNAIELMPSSEFHYTDVSKRGPGSDFCCWDVSWFSFTAYWFQFVNLNVMCMNSLRVLLWKL